VLPALAGAEQEFGIALARITLDDMARDAPPVHDLDSIGAIPVEGKVERFAGFAADPLAERR